jgi:hypothetical protein
LRHGNSLATIRYRMSDGLNFVVVDKVEVAIASFSHFQSVQFR